MDEMEDRWLSRVGMDAATYKDFIFGMLFLKRCSDAFEADYEKIVQRKTYQGLQVREAKSQYGENPVKSSSIGSPKRRGGFSCC